MPKSARKEPGILILTCCYRVLAPSHGEDSKTSEKGQNCQYSPQFGFGTWKPCAPPGRAEWGWIVAGIKAAEDTEGVEPDAWGTEKEDRHSACHKAARNNFTQWEMAKRSLNRVKFTTSLPAALWKSNPAKQVIKGQVKSHRNVNSSYI